MITGNEPAKACDLKEVINGSVAITHYRGLNIFQELSARFTQSFLLIGFKDEHAAKDGCGCAEALINEWNKREQSKTK